MKNARTTPLTAALLVLALAGCSAQSDTPAPSQQTTTASASPSPEASAVTATSSPTAAAASTPTPTESSAQGNPLFTYYSVTEDGEFTKATKENPSGLDFSAMVQNKEYEEYPYRALFTQAEAEELAARTMEVYLQLRNDPALLEAGRTRESDVEFLESHRSVVGQDVIDDFQRQVSDPVIGPGNLVLHDFHSQAKELGVELDPDGGHELTFSQLSAAAWEDNDYAEDAFMLTFQQSVGLRTTDEDVAFRIPTVVQIALRTGTSGTELQELHWQQIKEPELVDIPPRD